LWVVNCRQQGDNRPKSRAMRSKLAVRSLILFQLVFFRRRSFAVCCDLGGSTSDSEAPFEVTILFVPVSARLEQLAACWADDCDQIIIRLCPICKRDSIVGHGRRRKQAHDEYHDWIGIRRGRCSICGKTFTFLPLFSLPYTQFSLFARCQALWRRIEEHCSWEKAAPTLKDGDRQPDASTLRRWSRGLDCSEPAVSFVRQTTTCIARWLQRGHDSDPKAVALPWMASALEILWPLRL
jgi:hypothetical protein